ncbi:Uncharacterised protein [Mycobacteroides abscessus]|nr:Uncharacterised protein [Mycobacteroides abscessus]
MPSAMTTPESADRRASLVSAWRCSYPGSSGEPASIHAVDAGAPSASISPARWRIRASSTGAAAATTSAAVATGIPDRRHTPNMSRLNAIPNKPFSMSSRSKGAGSRWGDIRARARNAPGAVKTAAASISSAALTATPSR